MTISPAECEAIAREVADGSRRGPGPDHDLNDPRLPPIVFDKVWASLVRLAQAMAPDEPLLDYGQSYSYTASFKINVAVTLLVATDRAVWVVGEEKDGDLVGPWPLPYRQFQVQSKVFTTSVKIEQTPTGPLVVAQSSVAKWLERLNQQPPTIASEAVQRIHARAGLQAPIAPVAAPPAPAPTAPTAAPAAAGYPPVPHLRTAPPAAPPATPAPTAPASPPAWAADPYGRHELRFWDGTAWTAHVSDRGVQSTDPV